MQLSLRLIEIEEMLVRQNSISVFTRCWGGAAGHHQVTLLRLVKSSQGELSYNATKTALDK